MYMPQGHTPPCLFYLMPPIFCIDLCTAAKFKEKEQSCPISYYTTAKGLRALQEGERCRFQTPLAQNPALPLPTKVLFASGNDAKRSLLCICSQNWVVRVSNVESTVCYRQYSNTALYPVFPSILLPSTE